MKATAQKLAPPIQPEVYMEKLVFSDWAERKRRVGRHI